MDYFIKNAIMFLGSTSGILLIYIIIYTIYIVRLTGKHIYFLWLLIPIIPIVHFFLIKKSTKTWMIFVLMMLFFICFDHFAPSVPKQITKMSFSINAHQYIINMKERSKLMTDIKWDIYKTDFLRNFGILKSNYCYGGDLEIVVDKTIIIIHNYPLDNILKIVEKRQ